MGNKSQVVSEPLRPLSAPPAEATAAVTSTAVAEKAPEKPADKPGDNKPAVEPSNSVPVEQPKRKKFRLHPPGGEPVEHEAETVEDAIREFNSKAESERHGRVYRFAQLRPVEIK